MFDYGELADATEGFAARNLIGEGGFGFVYKGRLPDGKEVAVKMLKQTGSPRAERQFQAEVEIISRVHHRNLVSLLGYCICKDQRLLIYEFVPNGTLEQHLHGRHSSPETFFFHPMTFLPPPLEASDVRENTFAFMASIFLEKLSSKFLAPFEKSAGKFFREVGKKFLFEDFLFLPKAAVSGIR